MTTPSHKFDTRWKYEPRLRRSLVEIVWAPWNAVRSGTYLDEFLRARFWHHLAKMPQRPTDPTYQVEVEGTEIVRREISVPGTTPPSSLVVIERELEVARTLEVEATARVTSSTAALEQGEAALAQAVSDGSVHPRGKTAGASRPVMQPRWPIVTVACFLIVLACSEALMVAFPFWDAVGVDTRHLWTELHVQLIGVLAGAGFAIAAVVALIGASERLRDLWRIIWGLDATRRERWSNGTLLFGGGTLLAVSAYGLAAMRHGMSAATSAVAAGLSGGTTTGGFGAWVFVAVTLLILFASPKATSWLHRKLDERRRAAEAVRAHELEHEQMQVARERHEEVIATARVRLTEATRRRELAAVALRQVEARASEAATRERELAADDHRHAVAYSRALCAALEADRFAFIRRARRRGRDDLIGAATAPSLAIVAAAPAAVRVAS